MCLSFIIKKNGVEGIMFLSFLSSYHNIFIFIKIRNLLICFLMSCPIHDKDIFIKKVYIVLSCLIK